VLARTSRRDNEINNALVDVHAIFGVGILIKPHWLLFEWDFVPRDEDGVGSSRWGVWRTGEKT
jgi:hypothetical protein